MAEKFLRRGAYANVIDSQGRTPLHDVLVWARLDREEEVILTLNHLAKFGADPDTAAHRQTLQQLAETHVSMRIRDVFLPEKTQVRYTKRSLSTHNLNLPEGVQTAVCCSAAKYGLSSSTRYVNWPKIYEPGTSDIGRSRHDAEGSSLPQNPFPHVGRPGQDLVESKITQTTGREDSMVQKCGWTQLAKGFEASTNTSDQDDTKVVAHKSFGANFDISHTASLATDVWPETKTAKLIKGSQNTSTPSQACPAIAKEACRGVSNP